MSTTTAYTNLGEALKAVRLARGIGLREAARMLEVAPTTVWRMEAGHTEPSLQTLLGLCKFYSLDVNLASDGLFASFS